MKTGALALALLLLTGCSRSIENKQAVQEGISDYLAKRSNLDMSSMSFEVTSVSFRGNEAEATVQFAAKGATDPAQSMTMRYMLEKSEGRWVVKQRADSGQNGSPVNPHGEPMPAMPGGAAPPPSGELPPGHPPVGSTEKGGGPAK